jgi:hypothetical protein
VWREGNCGEEGADSPLEVLQPLPLVVEDLVASALVVHISQYTLG